MTAPVPVRVRGMLFPSLTAAAKHLGISVAAVWIAIEEGREDSVGLNSKPALRKPCRINGMTFISRTAAAAALGVTRAAISRAIAAGRGHVRTKTDAAPRAPQEQMDIAA